MGGANKQMVEPHFHDEFAEMPMKSWFCQNSVEKLAVTRCEGGRRGDARNLSGVRFCSSANIRVICGQSLLKA
jgi:hypothetical protein